jgi:RND superfamily putative drug exporter
VFVVWALVVISLGAFAPKVEHALAGAGWEAAGSQSVSARDVAQHDFAGMSSASLQVVVNAKGGMNRPGISGG